MDQNHLGIHQRRLQSLLVSLTFISYQSGYREGIVAGKEAFLQAGFDTGFADVGVPLGRELGTLRGIAAAMGSFLTSQKPDSQELEELRSISCLLSAIQFSDIAPRDLDAEQHAKEHLDLDSDRAVVENTQPETGPVPQESWSMEDVVKLKDRLTLLAVKLGLPVLL